MVESQDRKKKPYSAPSLTKLTPEQTTKLVADRRNCSEEEAADFLKSLRQQPLHDATDQQRKRSV